MTEGLITLAAIRSLARQGNHEIVRDLLSQAGRTKTLSPGEVSERLEGAASVARMRAGVLALVPDRDDRCPMAVEITVFRGEGLPAGLDPGARTAVECALDEAWRLSGGSGLRPTLGVWSDLLSLPGVQVEGRSLYLAVALAALSTLGEEPVPWVVTATGDPSGVVERLPAKQAIHQRVVRAFGTTARPRLFAASVEPIEPAEPSVQRVRSVDEAARALWGYVPWMPEADHYRGLHVHCSEARSRPPRRWSGAQRTRVVELGARMGPADVPRALETVRTAMDGDTRWELSLAVPNALAAALGWTLINAPPTVRMLDARSGDGAGEPWWVNRLDGLPTVASPVAQAEARAIFTCRPERAPEGWELVSIPEPVSRDAVWSIVNAARVRFAAASTLHMAVDGPAALAWALGGCFKNQKRVVIYQRDAARTDYVPWFDSDGG